LKGYPQEKDPVGEKENARLGPISEKLGTRFAVRGAQEKARPGELTQRSRHVGIMVGPVKPGEILYEGAWSRKKRAGAAKPHTMALLGPRP